MSQTPHGYDRSFYEGHGWDRLSGVEIQEARAFQESLEEQRRWLSLVGNLYEARVEADFPGSRCLLPINWLAMPERKFDYCLLQAQPGSSFPTHVHGYGDEIYLVMAGEGTVYIDGKAHPARKHDIFHIPPGTPHGFVASAESDETFDIFIVNAPAVRHDLRSRYFAAEPPENLGRSA